MILKEEKTREVPAEPPIPQLIVLTAKQLGTATTRVRHPHEP